MPKYTNKENPDIVIDVGEDDVLPGGPAAWDPEGGASPKRRRRADTGSVPVQGNGN